MTYLSFTLPGGQVISPNGGLPQGGLDYLTIVLKNALNLMLVVAVVLTLVFAVWAGAQWISSGGDKNKLASARSKLTWALVGLIFAFLAFFLVNLIGYFFNLKLI